MKIETLTACPACQSIAIHKYTTIPDFYFSKENFEIWECNTCTLRFTQNRPDKDSIGAFYDSSNYASHDSENKKTPFLLAYKLARDYMLNQKYRLLRGFKPEIHRSLDYGTGEGFYTEFLAKKGLNSWGIEPSEQARKNYMNRTRKKLFSSLEEISEKETFQSISLWHVLEHIHLLKETMSNLVSRLEKNGVMTIAVPNQKSKDLAAFGEHWAAWDVPRHLYHWDINSLGPFMKSLGLKNVHIGQLPLDPFYIGMVSSKYAGKSQLSGLLKGLSSYIHGYSKKDEGSTLLTVWMKK